MGDYLRKMIGAGSDCKKRAIGMGGVLGSIVGGGGMLKKTAGVGGWSVLPKRRLNISARSKTRGEYLHWSKQHKLHINADILLLLEHSALA